MALDVKLYVKSVFGATSPQYKQVSALKFTKRPKKQKITVFTEKWGRSLEKVTSPFQFSCLVTENSCNVTEKTRDVTEYSRDVTEKVSVVTEKSCDVIQYSCLVTEYSCMVTEKTRDVIQYSRLVTHSKPDKSPYTSSTHAKTPASPPARPRFWQECCHCRNTNVASNWVGSVDGDDKKN